MRDLEQLTQHTRRIADAAAAFIRAEAGKVRSTDVEEKFLNGLVSYVDRKAEEMLVEGLSKLLPEAGFLTEEETVEQTQNTDLQWIIDPLDGTTNFLYGVPHYSVSIGLRAGDDLVLGLVQHVLAGEQFYAWQGGGAWCNGQRIRVSERAALRQALVATGFPYHNFQRADAYFEVLRTLTAEGRGIRRYGSAALDLAWVACGRFDVFFEYGLNAWDVAGGTVLVREAGGQVTDFAGHTGLGFLDKREMLAANAAVFPAVQAVVGGGFSGG